MKAMVFAAGLGTRLRPYTNDRPKALVELNGQSLLEIILLRLQSFGVTEVVVNVHHYADLVIDFLASNNNFGLNIHISDERELLLDTGGGMKKAKALLSDAPFLIHNVDIISQLDLNELYKTHLTYKNALSTLAVSKRKTSRYLQFSDEGHLVAWRNAATGEKKISKLSQNAKDWAYSGIAVIDPTLFDFFPKEKKVFSIVETWLEAAKKGDLYNFPHDESHWLDVGKPATLAKAEVMLGQNKA